MANYTSTHTGAEIDLAVGSGSTTTGVIKDFTTLSGSATSTGSFGYLKVVGDAVINGNLTFGDADTDNVSFGADISSSLIPNANDTFDIGSSTKAWSKVYTDDLYLTGSGKGIYQDGTKRLTLGATNTFVGDISVTNITASGDISSSGTIYANNFESAGGDVGGISFADDLNITGDITASGTGIISASGNIITSGHVSASGNIYMTNTAGTDNSVVVLDSDGKLVTDEIDSKVWAGNLIDATGTPVNDQIAIWTDSDTLEGQTGLAYSASIFKVTGDISGSGDILLDEDQRIYFEADKQTWMEANGANLVRIVTNNNQMLLLDHETGNRVVFGNGSKVFIGNNNNALPSNTLEVDGDISASGDFYGKSTSTGSMGSFILNNLPTSKPSVTGSLWLSGSNSDGSKYLMVFTGN